MTRPAAADLPPFPLPCPEGEPLGFDPIYAHLQSTRPVAPVSYDGAPAWLVTGYEAARRVLANATVFSRAAAVGRHTTSGRPDGRFLTDLDGADHRRQREQVVGWFSRRRVNALHRVVEGVTTRLLDALAAGGQPADLVTCLSLRLPATIICHILGVPAADQPRFNGWADAMLSSGAYTSEQVREALMSLRAYMGVLIDVRRTAPGDDMISALVQACDSDGKLSEEEVGTLAVGLLIAGYETTASQLTNLVYTLLSRRDLWQQLLNTPALIPSAVEELLRYVPLGSDLGMPRVATTNVALCGELIKEGDTVFVARAIANRDPAVFADPDTIRFDRRDPPPHLGFGYGVHHCIGAQLARLELRVGIGALLERFPQLRIAVAEADLEWKRGLLVRGPITLPVAWDPPPNRR